MPKNTKKKSLSACLRRLAPTTQTPILAQRHYSIPDCALKPANLLKGEGSFFWGGRARMALFRLWWQHHLESSLGSSYTENDIIISATEGHTLDYWWANCNWPPEDI